MNPFQPTNTRFPSQSLPPILLGICLIGLLGCGVSSGGADEFDDTETTWLVPSHEVLDGGPGRDGIPPIDNPQFAPAGETEYIPDERRVLGLKRGDDVRAYPHQVLDWHEIVNDNYASRRVSVTYCPLTATGVAWIPRKGSEFGTSGRIFRNNLVAYDRNTGSLWVQMRLRAVHGPRMGENIEPLNVIDTRWDTWKKLYPDSEVLTTNTGYSRDYEAYAYGEEYSEKHGVFIFPPKYRHDTRLDAKERVHGIMADDTLDEDSTVRVYEIAKFGEGVTVIHDKLGEKEYVVAGSGSLDFAVAYRSVMRDGSRLTFRAVQNSLPVIMTDQEGNKWTVFGEAVAGPRKGEKLRPAKSYSGYWFGFRDIYRNPEIYSFNGQ